MAKKKAVKKDLGELSEEETQEQVQDQEEQVSEEKPKREKGPTIVISDEAFLEALENAGGEAKITPLYEKFDKTNYACVPAPKLKTVLRKKGLDLAKAGKIKAENPEEKRSYVFKVA